MTVLGPLLRRLVLGLGITLTTISPVWAQSHELGVKGGVSLTSFTGAFTTASPSHEGEKQFQTHPLIGAFYVHAISRLVAFEPEVFHGREGITVHGTPYGQGSHPVTEADERSFRYDIIRVPLLFRIGSRSSTETTPYLIAGPEVAFHFNVHDVIPSHSDTFNENYWNPVSLAVTAGAGLQIGRLLLEGRFAMGLTPMASSPDNGSPYRFFEYESRRRVVISILAGATF